MCNSHLVMLRGKMECVLYLSLCFPISLCCRYCTMCLVLLFSLVPRVLLSFSWTCQCWRLWVAMPWWEGWNWLSWCDLRVMEEGAKMGIFSQRFGKWWTKHITVSRNMEDLEIFACQNFHLKTLCGISSLSLSNKRQKLIDTFKCVETSRA